MSDIALKRPRNAVYAAFFVNGYMVGNWAPKIPFLVERLGVSETLFGQMIILFGVGAIIALIGAALMVGRYGSHNIVRWTMLLIAPALVLLTLAPTALTAALAMLWLGMFMGAMDNAMNANGIDVERALGRPVMSSYHGFWSIGGVVGGLTGGAMIGAFGEMGHGLIIGGITLAATFYFWNAFYIAPADEPTEGETQKRRGFSLPRDWRLYALGIVTMLCFAPEGTVIDWSALYLKDSLGAPVFVSGYAVAAFSATMAIMRLRGDGIRHRFGDRKTFIGGLLVAGFGLLIAGFANSVVLACAGFFISGLGMANTVPILFSTAGRFPKIKSQIAVAVITTFGYSGLLFIPALVGVVAEHISLSAVFIGWGVIVAAISLSVFLVRESESDAASHEAP